MALPHAKPMDVINVGPFGEELDGQVSTSLIKTDRMQLLHMVLAPKQDVPQHHVDEECTIHCLEGIVEVVTGAGVRQLRAGNLVLLPAKERHSLRARDQVAAVLVTLILNGGDAGSQGGTGHRRALDKDTPLKP
ncbi:cupin domain-containing protein [Ramlibacter sp. USB13]|uniref:Cupin domain-containing protein n=1 Tax=Ramlibacter cellulosilyticus TaxID=2764187 RepID=A0A923MQJ3_9BURK|nr:cupin domain-containing protein [Ramlibacter cellulosilyticus]MBC5782359.1 cupin domain-containing protein [Ramlibacter cellulosilyticus]